MPQSLVELLGEVAPLEVGVAEWLPEAGEGEGRAVKGEDQQDHRLSQRGGRVPSSWQTEGLPAVTRHAGRGIPRLPLQGMPELSTLYAGRRCDMKRGGAPWGGQQDRTRADTESAERTAGDPRPQRAG